MYLGIGWNLSISSDAYEFHGNLGTQRRFYLWSFPKLSSLLNDGVFYNSLDLHSQHTVLFPVLLTTRVLERGLGPIFFESSQYEYHCHLEDCGSSQRSFSNFKEKLSSDRGISLFPIGSWLCNCCCHCPLSAEKGSKWSISHLSHSYDILPNSDSITESPQISNLLRINGPRSIRSEAILIREAAYIWRSPRYPCWAIVNPIM